MIYCICVCVYVCIWCLVKSSNPVRAAGRPAARAAVLNLLSFRKPGLRVVPRDREMLRALWSQPGLAYRPLWLGDPLSVNHITL